MGFCVKLGPKTLVWCVLAEMWGEKTTLNMTTLSESIEFLKKAIAGHEFGNSCRPLIVGLSGPQGLGKSFLTASLVGELSSLYPSLSFVQFLMDDLYLPHEAQLAVSRAEPDNLMVQGRGLPGTHDLEMALHVFERLIKGLPVKIPLYDKSAYSGEGDRFPEDMWTNVSQRADVVLFEGWFNGYLYQDPDVIRLRWLGADGDSVLPKHKLFQVEEMNRRLLEYGRIWAYFDYFVYLNASISNVYGWRTEQEHALIEKYGAGMSDEQVRAFVDRYMPLYELHYEDMCEVGVVKRRGHNLELVVDERRQLVGRREV